MILFLLSLLLSQTHSYSCLNNTISCFFVSNAQTSSDYDTCGSQDIPCATIYDALRSGSEYDSIDVSVAEGSYEDVFPIVVSKSVSIKGSHRTKVTLYNSADFYYLGSSVSNLSLSTLTFNISKNENNPNVLLSYGEFYAKEVSWTLNSQSDIESYYVIDFSARSTKGSIVNCSFVCLSGTQNYHSIIYTYASSLTISECLFYGFVNQNDGGVVFVAANPCYFYFCSFKNTSSIAGVGGAICAVTFQTLEFHSCLFENVKSYLSGGAIYRHTDSACSNGFVINCTTFKNCSSGYGNSEDELIHGGAIYIRNHIFYRINGSSFENCSAKYYGGGICFWNSKGIINNTYFVNNSALISTLYGYSTVSSTDLYLNYTVFLSSHSEINGIDVSRNKNDIEIFDSFPGTCTDVSKNAWYDYRNGFLQYLDTCTGCKLAHTCAEGVGGIGTTTQNTYDPNFVSPPADPSPASRPQNSRLLLLALFLIALVLFVRA